MASSDDFREKLKAGNITEALTLALTEAATLKITTQVLSGTEDLAENQAKPGYRLQTQINAIEGAIENEIGDQFLGNGPYRELLQFHQDQVAQSNLMIQNNLQSLQKLFEVLIALRHPSVPQTITEPVFVEDKERLLPSSSLVAPGLVIEAQKSFTEEIPPTPDIPVADIPAAGWYIDEPESFTAEIPPIPDTSVDDIAIGGWAIDSQEFVVEEDVTPEETPLNRQEILDRQREEDDSVLDLLISLPAPPLPSEEGLQIQLEDGEWGEFLDEENLQLESEESESDLEERDWAILSEDWADLDLEEVDSAPGSSGLNVDALDFQIEPESLEIELPDNPISRLESLELAGEQEEAEDEWDDWVVDEPEIIQRVSPLDLQESQEWGDLMADFDPFVEAPSIQELPSDVDIGEDWDEFAVDELEPYSETLEVDSGFDLSDLLEDITPPPSSLYGSEDIDFRQDAEDDPIQKLDRFSSMSDRAPEVSSEMMDIFFEETQSRANRHQGGKRDDSSMANRKESIFDDMSFEEFSISLDEEEIELAAEDFGQLSDTEDEEEDWDEDINQSGKREPPPSPPSYFFKPKN